MTNYNSALFAPEVILEADGIACGDKLNIYAYRKEGCLHFCFRGKACEISRRTASWMEEKYSGKSEQYVYCEIMKKREMILGHNDVAFAEIGVKEKRWNCVLSPINLLLELFEQTAEGNEDEKNDFSLACDACVSMKRVNWNSSKGEKKKIKYEEMLDKISGLNEDEEKRMQRFGVCVLSEREQTEFQEFMKNLNVNQVKKIKKLRLAAPFYNNAIKYGLYIDSRVQELAMKQKVSTAIAEREIQNINNYIKSKALAIDAVKGGKTGAFYPQNHYRAHMDFDYLASDLKDASLLIDYMVNSRGFKLVIGGSVPFSFKVVLDENSCEKLTGHIHLEKILQDQYQVVVDINIGGFPLGRTGIICPNDSGIVGIEDLICITTAHLFKHEVAFMKDINDLYYLLQFKEIDEELLCQRLTKFNLVNFFCIVYNFMKKNLALEKDISICGDELITGISQEDWPFSKKAHFNIKAQEMKKLCIKQFGEEVGMKEAKNQICGNISENKSLMYGLLCERLNSRTYLYPIVLFNRFINIDDSLCSITDYMKKYKDIVVLPFGLFLMQTPLKGDVIREEVEEDIKFVMETIDIGEEDCNFDYIMEARKDIWLY